MAMSSFSAERGRQIQGGVISLYSTGLLLMAAVLLSPDALYWEGQTFFEVARSSPWERWWDWLAAWCSIKIILLSLGATFVIAAVGLWLRVVRWRTLGTVVLLLGALPLAGLWMGAYYLVKALL
jgi:hypothetical protein